MKYAYNALVSVQDYKVVLTAETRKKMRRIARKKYSKEYSEKKTYIIISGDTYKNAVALYKKSLENTPEKKKKSLSPEKKTDKKNKPEKKVEKKVSKGKPEKRRLGTMAEELAREEEERTARLNKKNKSEDIDPIFND